MSIELIIIIALISIGIIFLLVEIFLLPGITVAGIAGTIFMIAGIIYAYASLGTVAGNISIAASAIALGGFFALVIKSRAIQKIGLKSSIKETVDNSFLKKVNVGDRGIALSRLNPIGKVMIADVEMEGKSFDNEFIEEEAEIEVVKVDSVNVLVKCVSEKIETSSQNDDANEEKLASAKLRN